MIGMPENSEKSNGHKQSFQVNQNAENLVFGTFQQFRNIIQLMNSINRIQYFSKLLATRFYGH